MTVFQTVDTLLYNHTVNIYFAPDELVNFSQVYCLQVLYTSFQYFAISLAFAVESRYKEVLLHQSSKRFIGHPQHWKTSIRPETTNGSRFYVVLHADGSTAGELAIIRGLHMLPGYCMTTGKRRNCADYVNVRIMFTVHLS